MKQATTAKAWLVGAVCYETMLGYLMCRLE